MAKLHADTLCGALLLAIAIAFGWAAMGYDIGTPRRMGPGFFPLMAATILAAFSVAILIKGLATGRKKGTGDEPPSRIPWLPGFAIMGAVMFFGATASGLGLVPSVAITVLLASRAGDNSWLQSLMHCIVLTVLCAVIFQIGLGLQLPLFGPWLSGM
jgi:hypothetical protein